VRYITINIHVNHLYNS